MTNKELEDLLLALAVKANNTVMKGSFTGDDIHTASTLMHECKLIVDNIRDKNEPRED